MKKYYKSKHGGIFYMFDSKTKVCISLTLMSSGNCLVVDAMHPLYDESFAFVQAEENGFSEATMEEFRDMYNNVFDKIKTLCF